MIRNFLRRVVLPNWWRYLVVIAICFGYAFGKSLTGPTWYKAEATLAFKNRPDQLAEDPLRMMMNPLPVAFSEDPIEEQYDIATLLYSVNMANRVLGDELEEAYDPNEYDDLMDFYAKFLSRLSFEYDGDKKIVYLSFTYKTSEKAAEYCNRFAQAVEEFMQEVVDATAITPILLRRLEVAAVEAEVADAEAQRIAEAYGVPNLKEQPKEWGIAYHDAVVRSLQSQVKLEAVQSAIAEIRENRARRDLLDPPIGPPDQTIVQDLVLGALRIRTAMVNVAVALGEESVTEGSDATEALITERDFLNSYLAQQYRQGMDVETRSLVMNLQVYLAQNEMYERRADALLERLERIPRLEAEVRPVLREASVARTVAFTLERMANLLSIAEEYGIDPIRLIDPALPPKRPVEPAWDTLSYLLPAMLFVTTLWFALVVRMSDVARKNRATLVEEKK